MSDIPAVAEGRLVSGQRGAGAAAVGSPAWFAWLADDSATSFSYRSDLGNYTARKESRRRGGAYWVAYRTAGGRQHKVYLGKGDALTAANLSAAAMVLAERAGRAAITGSRTRAQAHRVRPDDPAPAAAGEPLLATKLYVPPPRPDLVPRPRLLTRLHRGLRTGRCTLLSAPAGAGKTSLLAAWIAEQDRPAGWLALDERDQDVSRFLRYLLAALRAVAPAVSRLDWFDGPAPPAESLLTDVINELAGHPEPGLLVLDDYHAVRSPAVHAAVGFLLDHLPPGLHLVVAGREDPPLPLPRLRARGQLVELRAAQLSFTVPEAGALLGAGLGVPLTDDQLTALVDPHRRVGGRLAAGRVGAAGPARSGGVRGRVRRRPPVGRRLPLGRGAGPPARADPPFPGRHRAPGPVLWIAVRCRSRRRRARRPAHAGGARAGQPVPGAAGRHPDLVPLPPPVRGRPARPPRRGVLGRADRRRAPAGQRLVRRPAAAAGGDPARTGRGRCRRRRRLHRGRGPDRGPGSGGLRQRRHPPRDADLADRAAGVAGPVPAAALPRTRLAADPPVAGRTGGRLGGRRRARVCRPNPVRTRSGSPARSPPCARCWPPSARSRTRPPPARWPSGRCTNCRPPTCRSAGWRRWRSRRRRWRRAAPSWPSGC